MEGKRTPLYAQHVEAGGKMVPFAGYVMPIEYSGIIAEHRAVRECMGMFDLSHMGEFRLYGDGALEGVNGLVTNDVASLDVGQARYTPMTRDDVGIVDDLLVYRYRDHVMLVVNASNIEKDFSWVQSHLPADVRLENVSDDVALIAVQGPASVEFLQSMTSLDLTAIGYYHFTESEVAGVRGTLSRTGYTGEDGFELYVDSTDAVSLWTALRKAGDPQGLTLAGLGARDTLRLEAGLALYGNDISDDTTPLEASLGWTVKFGEHQFVGRQTLERQKAEGVTRRLMAFEMRDRSIPRPHYPVLVEGRTVGEVASGTFSPTFGRGLGLAYVTADHARVGTAIEVEIRGQPHPAEIVKKPVYKRAAPVPA